MAVTNVLIACLITISTQYMEFECLDVNGAAIQASPNLISEFKLNKSSFLPSAFYFINLCVFSIFYLNVILKSFLILFNFFEYSYCLFLRSVYFPWIYFKLFIPTTAIPTSAALNPPTSLVPSPA